MNYKLPGWHEHEAVEVLPPMPLYRFWELVDLATEGDISATDTRELLSEAARLASLVAESREVEGQAKCQSCQEKVDG